MATSNETNTWAFLKGKGLSDNAVAGIMGNLEQESNFNPNDVNGIGAYGIAQWYQGRRTAEAQFAASRGEPANSLDAQLNYLWKEISSGSYGSVESMNNMDAASAALYFMNEFEKPGDNSGSTRVNNSLSILKQYTGKTETYNPSTDAGGSSSSSSGSSSGGSETSYSSNTDVITQLNQSLKIGNFSLTNPFQYAGAISLRLVFVVIGLLCVAFGLFAAVEKAVK